MKQIFLLFFVAICFTLNIQAQDISFNQKDIGNQKVIVCTNNSAKDFEVTFTYTSRGYTASAASPIKQIVKANTVQDIASFTAIKGQPTSLQMNYNYTEIRKSRAKESVAYNADGIIVFGKNYCGRCDYFIKELKTNHVSFKELNIDTSQGDKDLMWARLQAAGFSGSRITTPVVIVDNQVYYNIKDMNALLAQLKAKY